MEQGLIEFVTIDNPLAIDVSSTKIRDAAKGTDPKNWILTPYESYKYIMKHKGFLDNLKASSAVRRTPSILFQHFVTRMVARKICKSLEQLNKVLSVDSSEMSRRILRCGQSFLTEIDHQLISGRIHAFLLDDVRLCVDREQEYKQPADLFPQYVKGDDLKIGVVCTAANPLSIVHILKGLKAMGEYKLDKILYAPVGVDDDNPELGATMEWRYEMVRAMMRVFEPLMTFSDIGDLKNKMIDHVTMKNGEERYARDREDYAFRIFSLNPDKRITVYYITEGSHYRRFNERGKNDTINKLLENVIARRYGFNPDKHKVVGVFVKRGQVPQAPVFNPKTDADKIEVMDEGVVRFDIMDNPFEAGVIPAAIRRAINDKKHKNWMLTTYEAYKYIMEHPGYLDVLKRAASPVAMRYLSELTLPQIKDLVQKSFNRNHIWRTAIFFNRVAEVMGLGGKVLEDAAKAAAVHDLNDFGHLTLEQTREIATIGRDLLTKYIGVSPGKVYVCGYLLGKDKKYHPDIDQAGEAIYYKLIEYILDTEKVFDAYNRDKLADYIFDELSHEYFAIDILRRNNIVLNFLQYWLISRHVYYYSSFEELIIFSNITDISKGELVQFIDCAYVGDLGLDDSLDEVWGTVCDEVLRRQRMREKDLKRGESPQLIGRIFDLLKEFLLLSRISDNVLAMSIDNNGDEEALYQQVDALLNNPQTAPPVSSAISRQSSAIREPLNTNHQTKITIHSDNSSSPIEYDFDKQALPVIIALDSFNITEEELRVKSRFSGTLIAFRYYLTRTILNGKSWEAARKEFRAPYKEAYRLEVFSRLIENPFVDKVKFRKQLIKGRCSHQIFTKWLEKDLYFENWSVMIARALVGRVKIILSLMDLEK
ncbi:MAG: hypothetical protein KKF54_09735, partial [Candidatus Omnitrophica bacterium]|nr:hypothetical protein [Candidatus Omnitrophota bacterium]